MIPTLPENFETWNSFYASTYLTPYRQHVLCGGLPFYALTHTSFMFNIVCSYYCITIHCSRP
jgi:hypothetical protein